MARQQVQRRTIVLITSTSAALLLAGCASPSTPEDGSEPQTITFAYSIAADAQDWYQDIADAYEEANPGVTIETIKYGLDGYATTLRSQLQAGNAADVFYALAGTGQTASVIPLAQAGLLLPLDTTAIEDSLPESVSAGWSSEGEYYGVPTSAQVNGLVMNSALATQIGVEMTADSTLQEVVAQCAAAAGQGVAVIGLAGGGSPLSGPCQRRLRRQLRLRPRA